MVLPMVIKARGGNFQMAKEGSTSFNYSGTKYFRSREALSLIKRLQVGVALADSRHLDGS